MIGSEMEFTVGLVLYRPEPALFARLDIISRRGYHIHIFDNSPESTNQADSEMASRSSVTYITAGTNVGLGFAMSVICATAYMKGHERLLFLDQDTGITEQTLDYVRDRIVQHREILERDYAAIVFKSESGTGSEIHRTDLTISSGSLFALKALQVMGWHNKTYFVDCVDYEFSINARHNGYKLGVVHGTPGFDHISEQPDQALHMFGKRLLVRRYSARRIRDALSGYLRLIARCTAAFRIRDVYLLTRSLCIYISGQMLARVAIKSSNG
jgi:rhamnosyltransferase